MTQRRGFKSLLRPAPKTTDSSPRPERLTSIFCRCCGYQLNHLPAGRCPECGRKFDPEDLRTVTIAQNSAAPDDPAAIRAEKLRMTLWFIIICIALALFFAGLTVLGHLL